jgi:hypothetical protein
MKFTTSDKLIAYLTLLSGLTISAVAVWYSVAGLVAIFAAAVIPIIIMGVALEVSKLVATVWLKLNWQRAPIFIRTYLLTAIIILMIITSMGIFGFLSKAHSDNSLVSGDVQSRIAVYDEKITTEKENIEANRKALLQMDAQVDQLLGRSADERGAERAVQVRRNQARERTRLQNEISQSQKSIAELNEARAPIAAEVRKVEAEVGPIKYIANFIYGDNPEANVLEKAVTWVIIIIVVVFDPLAVILLLASQYSFQWFRKAQEQEEETKEQDVENFFTRGKLVARGLDSDEEQRLAQEANNKLSEIEKEFDIDATMESINDIKVENKPVVDYKVLDDVDEEDINAQVSLDAWNKMIEEAERAVLEEKKEETRFPKAPFTGQQFSLVTDGKEQYYVYNGKEWIMTPLNGEDKQAAEEALKWAQEQMEDRPGDYLPETEQSKKKITYIVKQNNQQVKKTKET